MPSVKVVIGANFGDEGKGLMTDYFCAEAINRKESCIVALCNGGAQRGHTVVTPDGIRHVFHHFGSGTLVGADTYLSEKYILNPMTFRKEYEELEAMGFFPKVYAHPWCMWSTPYDMMLNQIIEDNRGDKRHGSCGMGIWETIKRYRELSFKNYTLTEFNEGNFAWKSVWLKYLRDYYVKEQLKNVAHKEWIDILYSGALISNFIKDVEFMCNHITWIDATILQSYDTVVFENGQGLLLDQNQTEYGNNTTPSNTGIKNPYEIISKFLPNSNVEICYVTRTYLTRHGAGRFDEECNKNEINASIDDKTNVPNQYQGCLRYGKLDADALLERIEADVTSIDNGTYNVSLAITHLNEYGNKKLHSKLAIFENVYFSYGETRNDGFKIQLTTQN